MNEKELSLKIKNYLNSSSLGYNFKFIDSFCDIADEKNKIYIEVKPDHFAHAQLLHGIARAGIKKASFIGVADSVQAKLYVPIAFDKILSFAKSFDPQLVFSPSQVDKPELNALAEKLLGQPKKTIKFEFRVSQFLYITKDNMQEIRERTKKYNIQLDLLVNWLDGVDEQSNLKVNNHGWLVNMEKADMFTNEAPHEKTEKELTEFGETGFRRPKHIGIKPQDVSFFESLRVIHKDLADVLHEVDRLLTRKKRRERGVFWTESDIGDMLAGEILKLTKPDFVVEPCVGGGSLVNRIVPHANGTMNDISVGHVNNCKKIFEGYKWNFTTLDVVKTDTDDLMKTWKIPRGRVLLLYTNPPFGISATNRLVSKKSEMDGVVSRKQIIVSPPALQKYGSGNLFLPIVGRLIEVAKEQRTCYLAFFSPFGLYCGRRQYTRLFRALTKDFAFLKGYVFAGYNFHDINKTLPVALSIWKYAPKSDTQHLDLLFQFVDRSGAAKDLRFKVMPLLKDYWTYDRRDKGILKDEIIAQHCESFDTPAPKVMHLNPKQGGSELIPENVKIPLGIPDLPDELVYGLWSLAVGLGAFGTSLSNPIFPIYMRDAYVPLPNFKKKAAIEILAYSALHSLIKNYAEDRIGFFGANKVFRFGGPTLTKGVEHLFKTCKDCPVYDGHNLLEAIAMIKESDFDLTKLRRGIIDAVSVRLSHIGYWDHIPIPEEEKPENHLIESQD